MSTHANTNKDQAKSFGKYLRGVRSELKKVNWPNRKELTNHTTIVLGTCVVATLVLWILDTAFGYGLNFILNK